MKQITNLSKIKWQLRDRGYLASILLKKVTGGIEIIKIDMQNKMKKHFHPQKDETIFIIQGQGIIFIGINTFVAQPGKSFFVPRGVNHAIYPSEANIVYLIKSQGEISSPAIWLDDSEMKYQYGIYNANDLVGQAMALSHSMPPDKRQNKLTSKTKIILLYNWGEIIATTFVDFKSENQEIFVEYCDQIINPTEYSIWSVFILACKAAFPATQKIIIQNNHYQI